jgi:hypothetical protein
MGHKPNLEKKLPSCLKTSTNAKSGQLSFIQAKAILSTIRIGFGIFFADGHTEKQMIPLIFIIKTKRLFLR